MKKLTSEGKISLAVFVCGIVSALLLIILLVAVNKYAPHSGLFSLIGLVVFAYVAWITVFAYSVNTKLGEEKKCSAFFKENYETEKANAAELGRKKYTLEYQIEILQAQVASLQKELEEQKVIEIEPDEVPFEVKEEAVNTVEEEVLVEQVNEEPKPTQTAATKKTSKKKKA